MGDSLTGKAPEREMQVRILPTIASLVSSHPLTTKGERMRMNRPAFKPPERTHEGAKATVGTIHQQLKRSVLACLLWEDTFYESGVEIATRITDLVKKSDPTYVGDLARQARGPYNLRHAPLHLINGLIEAGKTNPAAREGLAELIYDVCQRADEPGELLALY